MSPCNCHPPFPRPEPFSPLPRPGKTPDWGKWIRDRLAEKGALLVFPTRATFPEEGAWPNLYLDRETGAVYRWENRTGYAVLVDPREGNDVLVYDSVAAFPDEGEQGKLYIAANTGSLYRWGGEGYVALLEGKADKAAPQTAGNFAALTQDGNLADSGKKPSDFATAAQGAKADTAVQPAAIAGFVDDAEYDAEYGAPPKPTILLKHGSEVVATVDATDFVIDGMVSNVEVKNGSLVITFNTDSGKQPISIPLTDIFDPDNYYNKGDVNALLAGKQNVLTFDSAPTAGSNNPVKSGGIWSAIWGTASTAFSSLYDWAVAQLGLKRDYTDLSYDTTETVEVPALHVTMRHYLSWQVIAEYDFLCTEEVPDPPQMGHVYTWRADGAAFYITQGVSALQTTWILYSQNGEVTEDIITTQNATQGFYPDVDFIANAAVITTHKTTVQKQVAKEDTIALESKTVPTSRTVNGKALSSNVTLTGADIAVSGSDATKINAALAGKASKADATLTERGFSEWTIKRDGVDVTSQVQQPAYGNIEEGVYGWTCPVIAGDKPVSGYTGINESDAISLSWSTTLDLDEDSPTFTYTATRTALQGYQLGSQDGKPLASEAEAEALRTGKADRAANPTAGNLAALDASGNPTDSGMKASDKLDSTSAAPAFSSDSSTQYAVGSHVTYNGKLYKCTTATTGGTWVAGSWTADTMTDPDAALDITAQNQLRVVAKDGTVLWAQGYNLASTSSATLACDATNNFTFADGATTQAFALPTAPTGKVGDFGLDIDNSANTGAATITLTGLDTTFSVVVPEGESLNDMLAIAAGELARFYITLTTFRVNNLPTWHILKQVVENGGATA